MIFNCPGSQRFKQPQPEDAVCPFCHAEVEIWTDEASATCPKCKNIVARRAWQSCLDWCGFARECVGKEVYNKYMKNRESVVE